MEQQGKLTIFAGGAAETFRQVLPVLEGMGKKVLWCGPWVVEIALVRNAVAVGECLVLGARGAEPLVP